MRKVTDPKLIEKLGGSPMQSATAGSIESPITSRKLDQPDPIQPGLTGGPSFGAEVKAAFVDDPATKASIYAQDLFPNNPFANERMGIMDGDIVYRGDNNEVYSTNRGGFGNLRDFAADQPAYLPHEIMGGIGAMAGPWTAALGVAGGEGYRKAMANLFFDEPQTVIGNIGGMATSGLLGGYLPAKGVDLFGKILQRKAARDIGRINKNDLMELDRLSRQEGIPLTIAEKSNLPSLKGYQTALNNITDSADDMARFYDARNANVDMAVNRMLQNISPVDSAEDAARAASKAAQAARGTIAQQMRTAAGPHYKAAYQSGPVDVGDLIDGISARLGKMPRGGEIQQKLNRVKKLLTKETTDRQGNIIRVPQDDLETLDFAKRELDNMVSTAKRQSGKGTLFNELDQTRRALLARMDEVSPDYAVARQIWTEGSDALDKVNSTAVKVIADLPEVKYQQAAVRMFNPKSTGPQAVKEAKRIIQSENPDAWNALTRAYIESAWEDAGDIASGTRGFTFKRMLYGGSEGSKRRKILKAALDDDQFKALDDLMTVLDATGRVKQAGSDTAYKTDIINQLNQKWGVGWNDITRPVSWFNEKLSQQRIGKNAQKLAKLITNQDDIATIKLVRQLPKDSIARMNAVAVLLGVNTQDDVGFNPPDKIPEQQ